MNLEASAASVLDQYPSAEHAELQRQERNLERFGQIAFGGFGLVLFAAIVGLIYTIVTRMILSGSNVWFGLLLTAFVTFSGLALSFVIVNESLKGKRGKLQTQILKPALPAQSTEKLLETHGGEPLPSVVEDTTSLLKTEVKTGQL